MKAFNPHRFGVLLRHDVMTARTRLLRQFLAAWICLSGILCTEAYIFRTSLHANPHDMGIREMMAGHAVAAATALFLFAVSSTFVLLRTKPQRIARLALPATNAEKYAASLLLGVAVPAVSVALALLLAGLTHAALVPLLGDWHHSLLPEIRDVVGSLNPIGQPFDATRWWTRVVCAALFLSEAAFFLLMGTLLRRHPFLTGSLVQFGLLLLYIVIATRFRRFDHWLWNAVSSSLPLTTLLLLAIAIALTWLSYRQFCRIQVTPRKLLCL